MPIYNNRSAEVAEEKTTQEQARIQRGGGGWAHAPPFLRPIFKKSPLNWPKLSWGAKPRTPCALFFQILDPPLKESRLNIVRRFPADSRNLSFFHHLESLDCCSLV